MLAFSFFGSPGYPESYPAYRPAALVTRLRHGRNVRSTSASRMARLCHCRAAMVGSARRGMLGKELRPNSNIRRISWQVRQSVHGAIGIRHGPNFHQSHARHAQILPWQRSFEVDPLTEALTNPHRLQARYAATSSPTEAYVMDQYVTSASIHVGILEFTLRLNGRWRYAEYRPHSRGH